MKKIVLGIFLGLVVSSGLIGQQVRNCNTMENQARLEALDPNLASVRARIEAQTAAFVDQYDDQGQDVVYNIPVVVHVVYNTTTQNISDAQIQSQLTVLNNDFRRLNADKVNTPAAWTSIAADCEINFCLATVDPTGAATTGITRTSTTVTSFVDDDAVKSNATGGKTAWDATKYLNLWVCPLGGGLLGYAQFPGGPVSTDGVVINYTAFGTSGTATAPFNKGRTATHEVGHWLNLYHIWGDDCGQGDGTCSAGSECSGSDAVTDTPNQCEMVYGNPAVGSVRTDGCTTTSPGVMYQNYMDYTDDAAMNIFTLGQKARMVAVMTGARASLATSNGCGAGTTTYCASSGSSTADEWIQTVAVGAFTNNSGNNGGYGNYTGTNVNLTKGVATGITLTPGYTATAYPEWWKLWIDLNNDKDFADAGELLYNSGSAATGARTGSITVPTTATATVTRMRISMKYNAAQTECEAFSYGEVEDYQVTLSSGTSCGNPASLSVSGITSSGATLNWAAVTGATSYNVQYKINGGTTWTTTTSTTNSKAVTGLAAATTYNWQVQAVCSGGNSAYVAGANFTTSAATCTDSYEANETSATAKTITRNTNVLAKICTATDIDWFTFTTLSTAPKVKITLTTLPADYDVYLYASNGTTLLGSSTNGSTTSEAIIYNTSTVAATYRIKVVGYNGAFNTATSYTLRAGTQAANWTRMSGPQQTVAKEGVDVLVDEMQVWPNPTSQNLFVNYLATTEGAATMTIMDLSGRILVNRSVDLIAGANTIDVNMDALADGMYIVRMQTATTSRNAKVQVMR
ncbi:MAG: T9SS type A sorting domain-containing protein [Bacteroidetes bacterium]|nr:T9SS type A sorting domain-containing protein [Bacteroidota bacterium]